MALGGYLLPGSVPSLGDGLHVDSHPAAFVVGRELGSGQEASGSADVPRSIPGLAEVCGALWREKGSRWGAVRGCMSHGGTHTRAQAPESKWCLCFIYFRSPVTAL